VGYPLFTCIRLGRPYDAAPYTERVRSAVAEVVAEQVKAGLDVVTDG
jgi:methionine synthase II (cobalamin-independent)